MTPEMILLRVAVVLALWAIPLTVGLIAHLGTWSKPPMAWAKALPDLETPTMDKAA
jgi:hypothetical protein